MKLLKYPSQYFLVFLLFSQCASTENTEITPEINQNQTINQMAKTYEINIFKNLALSNQENVFISPLSIKMAFGMLYNGVDGETKKEFDQILNNPSASLDAYNQLMRVTMEKLNQKKDIQLNVSNSFWVKEELKNAVKTNFIDILLENFNASTEFLDFRKAETPKIINKWVADKTNQKIKTIVPEELSPDHIAFLINTVYFDAKWTHPFQKEHTQELPFTTEKKASNNVSTMYQMRAVGYYETNDFQSIALNYGEKATSEAIIILPKNIHSFLKSLDEKMLKTMVEKRENKMGNIYLPKINFSYETDLIPSFQEIGMRKVFEDGTADLGAMFDLNQVGRPFVSSVLHKTFVRMDEAGTEAAGATSIGISVTSMPKIDFEFKVDKPYIILIRDTETGEILFMGKISDPSI
jgi:serpin B